MILIVDDLECNRDLLTRLLRRAGYETLAVASATEAMAALGRSKPSLAILDVQMPGMDGMALLRTIRADDRLAGVPILMYSSDFSHEQAQAARSAGAVDYLVKGTIGLDELLLRIGRSIEHRCPAPADTESRLTTHV